MAPDFLKSPPQRPDWLATNIDVRLVADLYYHAKSVVAGTLVLTAINFSFYNSKLPDPIVSLWIFLMLTSCLIRGSSIWRYDRVEGAGSQKRWHHEVILAYVVMSAGWSLLALSSVILLPPKESIVAIVTVAGISGSAAATTSASPIVFKSVAYIALAPLAIILLLSNDGALPYVGGMSACYLVVLNRASARVHNTLRQSVAFGLENEHLVESLEHLSSVDSLTGLSNRRALTQGFEEAWASAIRQRHQVGFILCDIDHFKEYNDTKGHLAGDRCLQNVAKALQSAIRSSDLTIARYGGEEFAVLLPNCENSQLEQICERLRAAVQDLAIPHESSLVEPVVTMSIGASYSLPAESTAVDDLIRAADSALYKAKNAGRNCVRLNSELVPAV